MMYQPTTLASVARLVGETLGGLYGIDPAAVFAEARIDTGKFQQPGSRVPFLKMTRLWELGVAASGDPRFGLRVGERARIGDFYVLGHTWLASATLLGAFRRLCRYSQVLSTAPRELELRVEGDTVSLARNFPDPTVAPNQAACEAGLASFIKLCGDVSRGPVRPIRAELTYPREIACDEFDALLRCPISYGNAAESLYFRREDVEAPLPSSIPDVVDATARIAERYIESLDQSRVATEVRQLLIRMLPSGHADQDTIANRLHRSTSTLQRQLSAEGTNYRDVLETTRRNLAEQYLRDGSYTQADIAYMVGFSDQSNFARAFKRWTGMSPGQFQKAA